MMKRLRLLTVVFVFFVAFVVCTAYLRAGPRPKLTTEELALRRQAAANHPVRLLELCPLADDDAAQALRLLAGKLLAEAPRAERVALARQLAPVLAEAARTPVEVRQILGPPTKVSRQVVYRRCLEQWLYEQPLALCLTWSIKHGESPHLESIHP